MFEVKLDKHAQRFLSKCEDVIFDRVSNKLDALKLNQVPHDAKRVMGYDLPTFRIRVGKYRVLYRVNYEAKRIIVVNIDKRDKVYG